ncbi:hypothetical protein SNEBB_006988 [Seison nebaliae]|nr:hypothetical protein SNEBB_006988 [Seison nebaliae]
MAKLEAMEIMPSSNFDTKLKMSQKKFNPFTTRKLEPVFASDTDDKKRSQSMKNAKSLHKNLMSLWRKQDARVGDDIDKILIQIKKECINLNFMPDEATDIMAPELLLMRDVLEISTMRAIDRKDVEQFEKQYDQLTSYYNDYGSLLQQSATYTQMKGLYLLFLLAKNRLAEFHAAIESIDPNLLQDDVYIQHPIQLEQHLTEGSYHKIFLAKANLPSERYGLFIDLLLDTIRNEIGRGIQESYKKMKVSEARRMLFFGEKDDKSFRKYIEKNRWKFNEKKDYLVFDVVEKDKDVNPNDIATPLSIPVKDVGLRLLDYAKQLERII